MKYSIFTFLISTFLICSDNEFKNMVFIPSGEFEMGDPFSKGGEDDNIPVHTVKIDSFYMDKYEVTVGEFMKFVDETGYEFKMSFWEKYYVSPTDNHPIVNVNWNDAVAYVNWVGKRLPTEAEWEYASRGGLNKKLYPWGNEISHAHANFNRFWDEEVDPNLPQIIDKKPKSKYWIRSAPVGSYPPNNFGLYDMAGNASEWCSDWYQWDYYKNSPKDNPKGPETGNTKVTRGGHWYSWHKGLRVANRGDNPPDVERWQDVQGFRCVKDIR